MPDIGELVVGAWLTQVQGYDFVVYNQRPGADLPEGFAPPGLAGVSARLGELDVIGLNTRSNTAYLAECTTHLDGFLIGSGTKDGIAKLARKLAIAGAYGQMLASRTAWTPELSVWSPRVSSAILSRWPEIEERAGHSAMLVANDDYASRVRDIAAQASRHTTITGNDFYRTLQLLTHLTSPVLANLPKNVGKAIREAVAAFAAPADGPLLTWADIQPIHRTQRGIRAPRGGTEASVICNTGPHAPYPDRFIGLDVLRYVGQGFHGDQQMTGDNESLRQAVERGIEIRIFEAVAKNAYRDQGMWFGAGEPEFHIEPSSGRRLVVFTLRRAA